MDLQSFLSEELWLFILIAIVLALFLPQVWLVDYAVYFLLIVMFLTSLKIGLREVGRVVRKQRRELCISLLLVYVLSPLIAFAFSFFLEKELAVGLILYSTIPAAMANTFYMGILKKNAALALMITAVTTLLAPLIAPVIMELLTGTMVEMDSLNLFLSLLLRRYSRRVTGALLNKSRLISNICIFIVIYGVISAAAGQIWGLGWLALVMLAYLSLSTVLGILSPKEKFVIGFSNGFRNGTLAMVVALEVFGPTAALIGVMSTLIHNIVLVPLMFWGKNKH